MEKEEREPRAVVCQGVSPWDEPCPLPAPCGAKCAASGSARSTSRIRTGIRARGVETTRRTQEAARKGGPGDFFS